MNIIVMGAGYVGLVSAACFAEFGVKVVCIDQDASRIERLRQGIIPIFEPGLDELVAKNVARGTLRFDTALQPSIQTADVVFIAVGTPTRRGDGHADSLVYAAAKEIAHNLSRPAVIVTKSTVPVGTGREIARILAEANPAAEFDVCSNPEFLREGSAINDFMRPDRVVIGCESERAEAVMKALYRPLYLIETPMVITALETAELIKYAANAFLAMKITFINEIADLCEKTGADVQTVAKGMSGADGRIGRKFLHAGPGYGGSCFPKDTLALARTGQDKGAPLRLVETTIDINARRKQHMAERIIAACGGAVQGKTIAILGLTFKPNTDDMRDSVSLDVVPALQKAGATIRAYDPAGMKEAKKLLNEVTWCTGPYDALQGVDAAAVLTEWNEFRALDIAQMKAAMKRPVLIDLRNIYRPEDFRAAGFRYESVGRKFPKLRGAP